MNGGKTVEIEALEIESQWWCRNRSKVRRHWILEMYIKMCFSCNLKSGEKISGRSSQLHYHDYKRIIIEIILF